MPPRKTVWPLEEHTIGKHIVLRSYLNAWLAILGTRNERVLFIDGFSGPGEYEGGEDGSPIVALRALHEHTYRDKINAEIIFAFIDSDQRRIDHLETKLAAYRDAHPKVKVETECGVCAEVVNRVLDHVTKDGGQLAPAFVMLDPFGVSYTPMSLIARLLKNDKCEIYISFMWESINRFRGEEEFATPLDELFGTDEWRQGMDLQSADRKAFFYELYEAQLRKAGAGQVTYFELFNENRHIYTIFFATKHRLGMDRMKSAIWTADPTGQFQFRGRAIDRTQTSLEIATEVDFEPLCLQIQEEFGGEKNVLSEDVVAWAQTDATDFHSGHVKRALTKMESDGRIVVDKATRKQPNRRSFANGTAFEVKPLDD